MRHVKDIEQSPAPWKTWLKRIGFAGFVFFLIKGLIWALIFIGIGNWF